MPAFDGGGRDGDVFVCGPSTMSLSSAEYERLLPVLSEYPALEYAVGVSKALKELAAPLSHCGVNIDVSQVQASFLLLP